MSKRAAVTVAAKPFSLASVTSRLGAVNLPPHIKLGQEGCMRSALSGRGLLVRLLVGCAVVLAAGCGGTDQQETPAATAAPASSIAIDIVSPQPNSTVKGNVVDLKLAPQGVQIVKADGDTSGKTGHFHLFVDRPVSQAGQPIPVAADVIHTAATTVKVPGLAPGEHTVTVVAGDGLHVPLSPPVEAKVSFTVGSQG